MSKILTTETPSVNIIGNGTDIKGNIKSNGDLRIDGFITGNINASGKVVVGSTGRVEGEISCQNADISGDVKANIKVTELLSLKANAVVSGDIFTNKLAIEPGAVFTGACKMGNNGSLNEKPEQFVQTEA
ncbi:MAG TPA: polymer-forming cytoskeletal protein [Bacteroidales bacterium]|jgi:cytoskeletal protein CcmA (bactofilin family)|nr:polymer-forming cytoskeletal protein [Bacteroidales bacterium]